MATHSSLPDNEKEINDPLRKMKAAQVMIFINCATKTFVETSAYVTQTEHRVRD